MHFMKKEYFDYQHNGVSYPVVVTRKRMKNIRYTFKNETFYVSAPYFFVTRKSIMQGLDKFADKLIKNNKEKTACGDDFIYLLGYKIQIQESGEIAFTNGETIKYKDREDLDKKLKKWFVKYLEVRVRYYEQQMGISKSYKVRVRKMSSRYGSNSSATHALTFSMILIHYSHDVIDSVIIHELAHDKIKDHSKRFYDVVYKYCPNYDSLHKRLRKGEFSW